MFRVIVFCISFLCFGVSCVKEQDCEESDFRCSHYPMFEDSSGSRVGWFYDEGTKTCREVYHTGDGDSGFPTKGECENCICN